MDRVLRGSSTRWANWESKLTERTCPECQDRHGKIVDISELKNRFTKIIHFFCQCLLVPMRTKEAGTVDSRNADIYLMYYGVLPEWYITKDEAMANGWSKKKKNFDNVLPGRVLGGDVFYNNKNKLPSKKGREWYEAYINHIRGERNMQRIVYSNDGLIFVTHDHYETFYELTQ